MGPFKSVVLDVDSTLCSIEGIDWLARQRGEAIAARVAAVTDRAMNGEIPLESVYGQRLALVEPDATLLHRLAQEYLASITPGAEEAVRAMHDAGIAVALVSGGIRQAIMPLAEHLGIPLERLQAVSVYIDEDGLYSTFDDGSPLATDRGKAWAVRQLSLPGPVLAVGDGRTDLEIRPEVSAFAAFVGHVRRDAVVAGADHVIVTFDELTELVLP